MKQRSLTARHLLVVASEIIIALAIITGIVFLRHDQFKTQVVSKPAAAKLAQSAFSFSGTEGWHKGPSNKTSMALFSDDSSCFTSVEYKIGTTDIDAKLQKQHDDLAASGATMTPTASLTVSMQAGKNQQDYELYQYSLSGGSGKLMGGLELGYIQLPEGYIEVQGHCSTANLLPITIAALQASSFNKPN